MASLLGFRFDEHPLFGMAWFCIPYTLQRFIGLYIISMIKFAYFNKSMFSKLCDKIHCKEHASHLSPSFGCVCLDTIKGCRLLCISTSERVLRTPFVGWNQFLTSFLCPFQSYNVKNNAKNNKKTYYKGGLPAIRCYS